MICYGGYVPKFAVCVGDTSTTEQAKSEPFFLGRTLAPGRRKRKDHPRGGFILPSHSGCFIPIVPQNPIFYGIHDDGEGDAGNKAEKCYKYEVLQVSTAGGVPTPGFVIPPMEKDTVIGHLAHIFQRHFHGTSQREFHDEISKLWAVSGLDADFFLPQALPWLLDLAQIHVFPACFQQCLAQLLATRELNTEEQLREAIQLARLLKHSSTSDGSGSKLFGNMEKSMG